MRNDKQRAFPHPPHRESAVDAKGTPQYQHQHVEFEGSSLTIGVPRVPIGTPRVVAVPDRVGGTRVDTES